MCGEGVHEKRAELHIGGERWGRERRIPVRHERGEISEEMYLGLYGFQLRCVDDFQRDKVYGREWES